ncbi:MAG: PKD domain-containing protein [Chloroflexota bacterium]|nr:PKD domain-containing protein [Chloroflexota bacterium]
MDRSTVTGGSVGASGAGVFNYNGAVTITASTFASNGANNGGGIYNFGQRSVEGHIGSTAILTVTNSTFTSNGGSFGGAIFNNAHSNGTAGAATATITNSTLSGNSASGLGGSNVSGGAIYNTGGSVTVRNSIVAYSRSSANPGNCSGAIDSASSNNLSDDASCGSSFTQVASADIQLGPLARNDGPTQTFALGAGSVAIDAGNATLCALAKPSGPGGVDQRGAMHMGTCDAGAFERGIGTSVSVSSSLNPSDVGEPVTFTADVSTSSGVLDGSVTFKDGASTLGTGVLDEDGQATFSTSSLTGGSHSITAVYDGSHSAISNYDVSTSPALTQVVNAVVHPLSVSLAGIGFGSVTSDPAGVTCGVDCSHEYIVGTVVTLTAVPASDSVFSGWSGDCANVTGACSVTMDAARTVTATFSISNRDPVADAGVDQTVGEGSSVALNAAGSSDPDGDSLTYSWSVSGADCPAVTLSPNANVANPSFVATDDGVCTFEVSVDDGKGGVVSDGATVTIDNVAPVVTLSEAMIQTAGSSAILEGSFTDAGALDTHTAVFDWGDGTTSDGTIDESFGSGTASGSHIYATPGLYTVSLTVTDDDGGTGDATYAYLVIVDPTGGKVVGAGTFSSPTGAYLADPSFVGAVALYVNVEHKQQAMSPSGHVQMHLVARPGRPELMLTSTDLDWLVVDGERAWMMGTASQLKIPGLWRSSQPQVEYGFLVSIVDGKPGRHGEPDLVRIKLWDSSTRAVIYDSQMGATDDDDATAELWHGEIMIR